MKIKGKKIEGVNREIIAIPRGNSEDIIFIAEAILDTKSFDELCPAPLAPKRLQDGVEIINSQDKDYLIQVDTYASKKLAWFVLTSLAATEELEWETVDLADSSTWLSYREELKSSGFSDVEINRIVVGVSIVNGLSEEKVQAARERFLLSRQEQQTE